MSGNKENVPDDLDVIINGSLATHAELALLETSAHAILESAAGEIAQEGGVRFERDGHDVHILLSTIAPMDEPSEVSIGFSVLSAQYELPLIRGEIDAEGSLALIGDKSDLRTLLATMDWVVGCCLDEDIMPTVVYMHNLACNLAKQTVSSDAKYLTTNLDSALMRNVSARIVDASGNPKILRKQKAFLVGQGENEGLLFVKSHECLSTVLDLADLEDYPALIMDFQLLNQDSVGRTYQLDHSGKQRLRIYDETTDPIESEHEWNALDMAGMFRPRSKQVRFFIDAAREFLVPQEGDFDTLLEALLDEPPSC